MFSLVKQACFMKDNTLRRWCQDIEAVRDRPGLTLYVRLWRLYLNLCLCPFVLCATVFEHIYLIFSLGIVQISDSANCSPWIASVESPRGVCLKNRCGIWTEWQIRLLQILSLILSAHSRAHLLLHTFLWRWLSIWLWYFNIIVKMREYREVIFNIFYEIS